MINENKIKDSQYFFDFSMLLGFHVQNLDFKKWIPVTKSGFQVQNQKIKLL